jgi:hypothetical protein
VKWKWSLALAAPETFSLTISVCSRMLSENRRIVTKLEMSGRMWTNLRRNYGICSEKMWYLSQSGSFPGQVFNSVIPGHERYTIDREVRHSSVHNEYGYHIILGIKQQKYTNSTLEPNTELLSPFWYLSRQNFTHCSLSPGSTWLQEMVWCIGNDLDFEGAKILQQLRTPLLE